MKFYRDTIHGIQQYLQNKQIPPDSPIDLNVILGPHSTVDAPFNDKQRTELKKWFHKMPNIKVLQSDSNEFVIARDHHIESVDFISHSYPMITWKNRVHFKTHSRARPAQNTENTVYRIKELINYYQLHSVFNQHSIEAKMILSRGLHPELVTAYSNLIANQIHQLNINDYHHLVGNLGLNILSYFSNTLCTDGTQLMELHHDLLQNKMVTIHDIQQKYNPALDDTTYATLCQFLIEYYALYFANTRKEYKHVIDGPTQRLSHLDVMPFLFEMKTLMKIGHLLDYINTYYSRLIYDMSWNRLGAEENGYYFDIHHNHTKQRGKQQHNRNSNRLFNKPYRVFSEKQLENGDCAFSVESCTPDIVLSQPIWINNKPIYWFDAKCTKATNCLYDKKRHYQMYRFTKHYGNGAILALGSADLSIVGINDVIILDCSHYL